MQKQSSVLALVASMIAIAVIVGCGQMKTSTAPNVSPTGSNEQLPLINGLGPPQETPPDSIVARAKAFFQGRIGPLSVAGVSGNTIGNAAKNWLDVRYVYGGNSRSGIDCSHLVYQVYRQAGISSYPYLTTSSMRTYGHFICINWPNEAGDIVMFSNLAHTGIYMGGGWMIDANSAYNKVMWDNLNSPYWQAQGPYPIRYMP